MTAAFAALVLKHDATAATKLAIALDLDAANDDWFAAQDNDEAWIDEMARTEGYRHARMPGE